MSEDFQQRRNLDADYYQRLHESNPAFQNNNWLTDELATLRSFGGRSLLEVGCGNGRFLRLAAGHWSEVVGVDWARSPLIGDVLRECPNVSFQQADVLSLRMDRKFDVVASADFLEHLPPEALPAALANLHRLGTVNFHKIACYDDGHSHLSIFPVERWLELFSQAAGAGTYRAHTITPRKGDKTKLVVTITNAPTGR